jgi:hypothetical protein
LETLHAQLQEQEGIFGAPGHDLLEATKINKTEKRSKYEDG